MFLMVGTRINIRIFEHRLQSEFIVNALQTLYKGICNHHFSIGTALCATIAVATAGIRHIAFTLVDVQQRIDDIHFSLFVKKCDEWGRGAVSVPDGIIVIIVGCFRP